MIQITLITESYELKPNTKNSYQLKDKTYEIISESTLSKYINSISFFRSKGGKEKIEYDYTAYAGYRPTKLTSTSPKKELKVIRYFKYELLQN